MGWDFTIKKEQRQKTKKQKQKKREQRKISKILSHNDNEVNSFLASDSYFNQLIESACQHITSQNRSQNEKCCESKKHKSR